METWRPLIFFMCLFSFIPLSKFDKWGSILNLFSIEFYLNLQRQSAPFRRRPNDFSFLFSSSLQWCNNPCTFVRFKQHVDLLKSCTSCLIKKPHSLNFYISISFLSSNSQHDAKLISFWLRKRHRSFHRRIRNKLMMMNISFLH